MGSAPPTASMLPSGLTAIVCMPHPGWLLLAMRSSSDLTGLGGRMMSCICSVTALTHTSLLHLVPTTTCVSLTQACRSKIGDLTGCDHFEKCALQHMYVGVCMAHASHCFGDLHKQSTCHCGANSKAWAESLAGVGAALMTRHPLEYAREVSCIKVWCRMFTLWIQQHFS